MVKEDIEAMFPVPKNAILTKNKKKLAILISLDFRGLVLMDPDGLGVSQYVLPLKDLNSKKYNCCSKSIQVNTTME